jgi:hypothetical protein
MILVVDRDRSLLASFIGVPPATLIDDLEQFVP